MLQRIRLRPFLFLLVVIAVGAFGAQTLLTSVTQWPHIPTRGAMLHPFGVPVSYQTCGFQNHHYLLDL
jgi:hypothetical protein